MMGLPEEKGSELVSYPKVDIYGEQLEETARVEVALRAYNFTEKVSDDISNS